MINKLQNLAKGESTVYYTGRTPRSNERPEALATAWIMYMNGRVNLVQKLLQREGNAETVGVFEYIAQGR